MSLNFRIRFVVILIVTTVGPGAFTDSAKAQHIKVPEDPVHFVDAVTGKTISVVLVMPLYSSHKGVFIAPEGSGKATSRSYLDNPFKYRAGDPFKVRQPRVFAGVPLLFVYIGKFNDLDGILVVAHNYYPLWTDDLWWPPGQQRRLKLSPIPHERWLELMKSDLGPVLNNGSRLREHCEIWQIGERCDLKIRYDKEERDLVRSFLTTDAEGPR